MSRRQAVLPTCLDTACLHHRIPAAVHRAVRAGVRHAHTRYHELLAHGSIATIRRHRSNIDLYINHYLLYEQVIDPADGSSDVSGYLGFWFIRKVWASEYTTHSNAASLRKFYGFMVERGDLEAEELARMNEQIKVGMPGYLARVKR